ncbi:MAG: hypothetical protein LM560_08100 [Desulfurococcaceae archaeon]|nr:hypothetical protein [Desulfurococcaceae archaeon]
MRVIIPLHITGFWYVVESYNPVFTGSLGAGITLDPPAIAEEGNYNCDLVINDECVVSPVIITARKLAQVSSDSGVSLRSKAMLGNGYGLSAASVLAYLIIKTDYTLNKASITAHVAEVLNKTGYGDVIAEFYGGGLVLRTQPGPPGIGSVDIIPVSKSLKVVTVVLGNLTTTEMMLRYGRKINEVGKSVYRRFLENTTIESFVELAHEFSLSVGMLSKDLDDLLKSKLSRYLSNGGVLGYFIKKKLLTVIVEDGCLVEVVEVLKKYVGMPKVFNIARHGLIVMPK